jgi:hypothetical protein
VLRHAFSLIVPLVWRSDPAPPISLSSSCSSSLSLSCPAPLIVCAYSARSFGPVSRSSILAYMFRHSWHSADPTEELHVICLRPSLRLHLLKMLAAPSKPRRDPIASALLTAGSAPARAGSAQRPASARRAALARADPPLLSALRGSQLARVAASRYVREQASTSVGTHWSSHEGQLLRPSVVVQSTCMSPSIPR